MVMKLRTLLTIILLGDMIMESLGLPIEKELLRVKRKGEMDGESEEGRIQRRELKPLTRKTILSLNEQGEAEDGLGIRRRRRFQSDQGSTEEDVENYPNKMAARSSRSSREDKDVTARGFDRFTLPNDDTKGNKQPAKRSIVTSSSDLESDLESSASGMWISDSAAKDIVSGKVDTKRSTNSIESIVAALSAITTDHTVDINEENGSSASGAWVISGSGNDINTQDDELPKFFSAAASNTHYMEVGEAVSGSGSGSEESSVAPKEGNLIKDLAEEVNENKSPSAKMTSKPEAAKYEAEHLSTVTKPIEVHKRDILEQFFGENRKDVIFRRRREQVDEEAEGLTSFLGNVEHDNINGESDLPIKKEPPPIPAERRSGHSESVNGGEVLTGLGLMRRFYRDQNMEQTGQTREVIPKKFNFVKQIITNEPMANNIKEKLNSQNEEKMSNPFQPRVVHKKQLPKAHVTIIEEPALYTTNGEEGMDSSDGGMNESDSDESEPTIEIHERDIREDGYIGCYADQTPHRDLPFAVSVRDLTPTTCRMACKKTQHAYAGLQYGYLCRCGDSYGKYSRLPENQCTVACKGDPTQICGGFFRSSIYATDGVTEPTQGDFFHVESIRPLDAAFITKPTPDTNYMPIETSHSPSSPYHTPNQFPYNNPVVQFAPSIQTPTYFTPDEPKVIIHSETPLPEFQSKPLPKEQVINTPVQRSSFHPSIIGEMGLPLKKSSIAKPPVQATPQEAQVGRLQYLHQQHAVAPKPKSQFQIFDHMESEPGTKTFSGRIKLKQSWMDGLKNEQSPEFKILSGNLEQAFKKLFTEDPNFIKAKVIGFNKGLVKHNPSTITKVVAPFILTFKKETTGIESRVTKAIQETGKLFDMPVYKKSIHIQEVPYTLDLFLMRDPGKIKRTLSARE